VEYAAGGQARVAADAGRVGRELERPPLRAVRGWCPQQVGQTVGVDDLLIRPFEEADRVALVELWEHCSLTRPWNDPHRDIDRKLALGDRLLLVAVRSADLVGSVMAGYDGHRGWVNYLAVDPGQRRRGVATALIDAAVERLGELGCPKVNLQIRRANADAVRFYASLGFVEDDVISMGKRLVDDTVEPS